MTIGADVILMPFIIVVDMLIVFGVDGASTVFAFVPILYDAFVAIGAYTPTACIIHVVCVVNASTHVATSPPILPAFVAECVFTVIAIDGDELVGQRKTTMLTFFDFIVLHKNLHSYSFMVNNYCR
jgi:hypothetical protein